MQENTMNNKNSMESEAKAKNIKKKDLQKSLEKIKAKRKKLNTTNHDSSKKKLLNELFQEVGSLEKKVESLSNTKEVVNTPLIETSKEELFQNFIEKGLEEYNEYTQKMEELLKEEKKAFERQMLSDDEIESLLSHFIEQKMDLNQASVLSKRTIFDGKKMLNTLQKKEINEEVHEEKASESKTIQKEMENEIQKEVVHDAAINKEALSKIFEDIQKEAVHEAPIKKEETYNSIIDEVKEMITEQEEVVHEAPIKKEINNDIIEKVEEIKADPPEVVHEAAVSTNISNEVQATAQEIEEKEYEIESTKEETLKDETELLYFVDSEYLEYAYPRILIINPHQYSAIEKYVEKAPLKVTGSTKNFDYIPDKAPSDLEHTLPAKENIVLEQTVVLYQNNSSDNSKMYANIDTLKRYGVFPNNQSIIIDRVPYYEIREEDIKKIENYATIQYVELPRESVKEEKAEKEVEQVPTINYQAENIYASNDFLEKLKSEEQYNIVHSVNANKTISEKLLKYLNGDLQKEIEQYNDSLEQLTDNELLEEVYKKEQSDALNQLSDSILERLKNHVISKLEICEYQLQEEYANLFYNISQIKMLEESLPVADEETERASYIQERRLRLKKAVSSIEEILSIREEADYLLGKGIFINISRVYEEFPYIGMKYAKNLPFEIENLIDENQTKLNEAFKENDLEAIVSSFINLDSCYYEDMGVGNYIEESRSIGIKYHDILVNQFRYQDDDLSRRLIAARVLSAAEVHVASAEYVYEIKSGKLLKESVLPTSSEKWDMDTSAISDDIQKLDTIIIDYQTRRIGRDEVNQGLEYLSYTSHSRLVEAVNDIINRLNQYREKYPELDVNALQEKLEVIIAHPEIICTKRIEGSEAILTYLSNIPKDALIYLVLSASTCEMITDISTEILDRYNQNIEK